MADKVPKVDRWLHWIGIAAASAMLTMPLAATAQIANWPAPHTYQYKMRPDVQIPLAPLGYRPPGELPAFNNYSLVSLNFADKDHLIFSFNTSGLMTRKEGCSDDDSPRLVQTVLLDLPSGNVAKQAKWELFDYGTFVWPLRDGQFLLRRCAQLYVFDSSLELHSLIHVDGAFRLLTQSADRTMLLLEDKEKNAKPEPEPEGTGASVIAGAPAFIHKTKLRDIDVDFIRLHPLGVLATSRTQEAVDLPMMEDGFLEVIDQTHDMWQINLQPYHGTLKSVAQIHSACAPQLLPLSITTFLAIICKDYTQTALMYQAFDERGNLVWQQPIGQNRIAPQFMYAEDMSRMAVSTLHTTHQIAALDPLNSEDIDGQIIDVYDVPTGKLLLSFRNMPIYTAGHNYALSPNGDRLAVLHNGAIEVYDLTSLPSGPPPGLN